MPPAMCESRKQWWCNSDKATYISFVISDLFINIVIAQDGVDCVSLASLVDH